MYTLLLVVVVLAFLLEPAAASNPSSIMDYTTACVPMEPFFAAHQELLDPICHFCTPPFCQCMNAMAQVPFTAAAQMLQYEPQPQLPYESHHQYEPQPFHTGLTAAELAPIFAYVNAVDAPPLDNDNVYCLNTNETTVQSETVQAHIDDIYTPGDRELEAQKSPHRRQVPRTAGYPCKHEGCGKRFDRACELNRHRKTHLKRTERPHRCLICREGFLYPKDLHRHQNKHIEQRSTQTTYFCRHPGCSNMEGFSRRDNLLRHQRRQHTPIVAAA